jgi:hypothetical protein
MCLHDTVVSVSAHMPLTAYRCPKSMEIYYVNELDANIRGT